MKTRVYVDGFNLYYGALKRTPYKWLNLDLLCHHLLPNSTIDHIYYCTAPVSARPHDPHKPQRQNVYIRALRTIPHLTVTMGHFRTHNVCLPLAIPPASPPRSFVCVEKTEEKGSDVNIATHLLCDAFLGKFDVAVVISNDSDLAMPIRVVGQELGLPVGVLNPHKLPSSQLRKLASFLYPIRAGALAVSQFPTTLVAANGKTLTKPASW